jgi:hypothetical protein
MGMNFGPGCLLCHLDRVTPFSSAKDYNSVIFAEEGKSVYENACQVLSS